MCYKIKINYHGGEDHYFVIRSEKTPLEVFEDAKEKDYILIDDDKVLIPFKDIFMIENLGEIR